MSSHYIYVRCSIEGCDKYGSIYTGDIVLDDFQEDQFEMETISVPCDEHLGAVVTVVDRPNNRDETETIELVARALAEVDFSDVFEPLADDPTFDEPDVQALYMVNLDKRRGMYREKYRETAATAVGALIKAGLLFSLPVSPKNLDPEPWTGTDGRLRHSSAIHGKGGYCLFAPRPEYEQLRDRDETERP